MKHYLINGKKLPIPSFFQVYNFGGGHGDKDREIVYAELSHNTPALVNYFYINNDELKEIIFAKTIHYLEQLENRWPFTDRTIINRPYNQ